MAPTLSFYLEHEAVLSLEHRSRQNAGSKSHRSPAVVRLKLVGANQNPRVVGVEELPGKSNHFIGNDPKKWQRNVRNYARVRYEQVYAGVDLEYYGNQGSLEYDFSLAPAANAKQIKFEVVGEPSSLPSLRIASNGDLVAKIEGEEIRINKPVVFQPSDSSEVCLKTHQEVPGSVRFGGRQSRLVKTRTIRSLQAVSHRSSYYIHELCWGWQ